MSRDHACALTAAALTAGLLAVAVHLSGCLPLAVTLRPSPRRLAEMVAPVAAPSPCPGAETCHPDADGAGYSCRCPEAQDPDPHCGEGGFWADESDESSEGGEFDEEGQPVWRCLERLEEVNP